MAEATVRLSIVTPTYNRASKVTQSIDSALPWAEATGDIELVVVDDASSDGTVALLNSRYASAIATGHLRVHRLERNSGAAGAKNAGARLARGTWVMFLDSDDALIPSAGPLLLRQLEQFPDAPVHFFRCHSLSDGRLLGAAAPVDADVPATLYLRGWAFGECLPVVRRSAALAFPYIEELRGHEGVSYARMLKALGPGRVSAIVARLYDDSGDDRLSRLDARIARAREMATGYAILVKEFKRELGLAGVAGTALRWLKYRCLALSKPGAR